jgi:hypothetical protein
METKEEFLERIGDKVPAELTEEELRKVALYLKDAGFEKTIENVVKQAGIILAKETEKEKIKPLLNNIAKALQKILQLPRLAIKVVPSYLQKNSYYKGFKLVEKTTTSTYRHKSGELVKRNYKRYFAVRRMAGKEENIYLGNTLQHDVVRRKIEKWLSKQKD